MRDKSHQRSEKRNSRVLSRDTLELERSGVATNEAVTIAGIAQSLRRSVAQTGRLVSFGIDGDYADQSISYRADGRIDCISNTTFLSVQSESSVDQFIKHKGRNKPRPGSGVL